MWYFNKKKKKHNCILYYNYNCYLNRYIQYLAKMSTVKKVTATYKTNLNTNHDEELILNVIDF